MPPQRSKLRRTGTLTGSFYDKSGAIADAAVASPTATASRDADMGDVASGKADHDSDSDDEHCLTGYGEVSTETPFMLPPSPTQTVKYRYRAYRPKRAGVSKKYRAAKAKSSASLNNKSDYASLLGPAFEGLAGRSPKRDFQALLHKYRESAEGWRDTTEAYSSPTKTYSDKAWSPAGTPTATPLRREGSRLGRNAF